MPIWSALLGRIAGEPLAGRQVVGVAVSVLGIGLAFFEPGRALGGGALSLLGDGLLLLTGLLGALYGLIAKRALAVDSPATVTTYAMLFGTLVLLPAAVAEGLVPAIGRLNGGLLGIDDGSPRGDPSHRVDELLHIADPVLEQVAHPAPRPRRGSASSSSAA